MENCRKFGQLILSKISKIVATNCQISRLKCTKFNFEWGSAPDPAVELTALPRPPNWINSACIDPEVKRSNVKVTQLRKHRGHMADAACSRRATAAGLGLHVV